MPLFWKYFSLLTLSPYGIFRFFFFFLRNYLLLIFLCRICGSIFSLLLFFFLFLFLGSKTQEKEENFDIKVKRRSNLWHYFNHSIVNFISNFRNSWSRVLSIYIRLLGNWSDAFYCYYLKCIHCHAIKISQVVRYFDFSFNFYE